MIEFASAGFMAIFQIEMVTKTSFSQDISPRTYNKRTPSDVQTEKLIAYMDDLGE